MADQAALPLMLLALLALGAQHVAGCETVFDASKSKLSGDISELQNANLTRHFRRVLRCEGAPAYKLLMHLWTPRIVEMDCGTFASYAFYTAPNEEQLLAHVEAKEATWCNALDFVLKPGKCTLSLTPFGTTLIGITGTSSCRVWTAMEFNSLMAVTFVVGLVVFCLADSLSKSTGFRVTSGGLIFVLGSVVILSIVCMRMVPNRRGIAATMALVGSSSWGMLRWLTGQWAPSVATLLHNKVFLIYIACTGLLGSAVTYIYGGTDNYKVNNVVRVGLQLLGLMMLYYGTWTHLGASAAVLTAVVLTQLVLALRRAVARWRSARPYAATSAQQQQQQRYGRQRQQQGHADEDHYRYQQEQEEDEGQRSGGPASFSFWANARTPASGHQQQQHQQHSPLMSGGAARQQYRTTPSSNAFLTSPTRRTLAPGGGAQRTPDTGRGSMGVSAAAGGDDAISPLVRAGKILNPLTGRDIKIGGDLYNDLLERGYVPDVAGGVLRAPGTTPGSGRSGGGDSARRRRRSRAGYAD